MFRVSRSQIDNVRVGHVCVSYPDEGLGCVWISHHSLSTTATLAAFHNISPPLPDLSSHLTYSLLFHFHMHTYDRFLFCIVHCKFAHFSPLGDPLDLDLVPVGESERYLKIYLSNFFAKNPTTKQIELTTAHNATDTLGSDLQGLQKRLTPSRDVKLQWSRRGAIGSSGSRAC